MSKTPKAEEAPEAFDAPDPTDNAKTRAATDARRYDPLTHQWLSEPAPEATPDLE